MELSAEEALEALRAKGVTVMPGLKTLEQAAHGKVFSGRKEDGTLWKVCKVNDDRFIVDEEPYGG